MRDILSLSPELLAQQHVECLNLVELDWPSGTVRVHSGLGKVTYNGQSYIGIGNLGSIDSLTDTGEVGDTGISLTLSGVDAALVAAVVDDDAIESSGRVFFAVLDEHSRLHDANVCPLFAGTVKRVVVRQGNQPQITVELVADAINRPRCGNWRWTDNSHRQRTDADDGFCKFIEKMAERPFYWGSQKDGLPLKVDKG
jgi:hypothetical protein